MPISRIKPNLGFGWDDGLDAALLEISADGIGNLRDFCPTQSIDPGRVDRQVPSSVIFPARARRRLAGRSGQARFEAGDGLLGAHSAAELTHNGHRNKDRCRGREVKSSS